MTESANNESKKTTMQWFDLSAKGIFITPEIICGKPCVLLLDSPLIFSETVTRRIALEELGFEPIVFESRKQTKKFLYVKFTESIDSDFLIDGFGIPADSIQIIEKPLLEIQTIFYKLASECYDFRVDVLIKSSLLLGINHQGAEVYSSMFGRYKISKTGENKSESIYSLEEMEGRNLAYLRATTPGDVLSCCEGFVSDALKKRRNVSLVDAMLFASILFQVKNTPLSPENVQPQQILMPLNAFNLIYIKNIVPGSVDEIKQDAYFSNRDNFKNICLNSEACPSPPRAIYTNFMANQYSTPSPLSFIMQKLLIGDQGANLSDSVLDPMFGFGSLTSILSAKGMPILGLEKNVKKAEMVRSVNFNNTRIEVADCLAGNLMTHSKDGQPFKYVICNPACYINSITHEFKGNDTSIKVKRSDFGVLLKSLMARMDGGRTVFLIPYFIEDVGEISQNQTSEIDELLSFIHARFNIEGVASISSEIYSKSLKKISPLLLVVGDKRDHFNEAPQNFLNDALNNPILNYESLWDWSNLLCYKRSESSKADRQLYEEASKLEVQDVKDISYSSTKSDSNGFELPDIDFESKPATVKPVNKLADSNALFGGLKEEAPDVLVDTPTTAKEAEGQPDSPTAETNPPDEQTKVNEPEDADAHTGGGLPDDADEVDDTDHAVGITNTNTSGDTKDKGTDTTTATKDKGTDTTSDTSGDTLKDGRSPIGLNKSSLKLEKDKIAKNNGNLFSLNAVNKVIRYHSTATLTEPTANVHQSDFGAYLNAKQNLNNLITKAFEGISDSPSSASFNDLNDYKTKYELNVSVEAFIGATLGLGHPKNWSSYFKSEHLDLISTAILKFQSNRSLIVLDSIGLKPEVAIVALLEFNQRSNKASFIVVKSRLYLDKIIAEYRELHSTLFSTTNEIKFVVLNDFENPATELKKFKTDTAFVVISDPKQKPLNIAIKDISTEYQSNLVVFQETDFAGIKQINPFFNMLFKSSNFYISSRFIGSDTNIKTIQTVFPPNVNYRYFSSGLNELDDMSSHLLKIKMIEDLALFQRFEDLSFIDLLKTEDLNNWSDRFAVLAKSCSSSINNIVLLAEEIHKNHDSKPNNLLPRLRTIAMQIYELCTLCITSIPLTHSIFKAVREQSKPIVVLPKNIESTLFLLLESLSVDVVKNDDSVYVNTLAELNQYIDHKKRLMEQDGGLNNTTDDYYENLRDLENHIAVRNHSVFNYLTYGKSGGKSKFPDLTSLIAAFYRNCTLGLHEDLANYSELKLMANKVESEINALMDLPLLIADFIKYELAQHQISSGEISDRTFAIDFPGSTWSVQRSSPCFTLLNSENSKYKIASDFNSGNLDVLFVEADAIDGLQLSSIRDTESIVSDHNRKRVLLLTYLNKPIKHYLPLIHLVSDPEQFSPPEVYCELLLTPVQKVYYQLFVQQLELFNVRTELTFKIYTHISYFLSEVGQKLITEYLNINPSYLAYKPNTPVQHWNIYDVLNVVNMAGIGLESNILDHLNYFARQHLDFLKDIKANPFDIFTVSPKAHIQHNSLDKDVLYLSHNLKQDIDGVYYGEIKQSTLSYVKNTGDQLSLNQCSEYHQSQKSVEISALKSILKNQFRDESLAKNENVSHADWVGLYIENYTKYLISVFRDKVVSKLHDRYRKWIFSPLSRVSDKAYVESHFRHHHALRVSNNLDDLYFEILMLADMELIEDFENACKVLTFLKAYHLTISKQDGIGSPIMMPIPSPFNDRFTQVSEGFLMRVDFPPSVMISLSAKAFSVSVAYPSKSKPIELNLAYVLKHHRVLEGQSVLNRIDIGRQKSILRAYKSSSFKDLLAQKIKDFDPVKISGFTDLVALNQSEHHPTIMAFRKKEQPYKLRYMYVIHGNLFDFYYFLRRLIPLTMVSFTNENGLAVQGFVVSPNLSTDEILLHLIRPTQLHNVGKVLKLVEQQNAQQYLRSIQWHGDAGMLEVGYLDKSEVELNFMGKQSQLQNVFSSKQIFKEYPFNESVLDADAIGFVNSKAVSIVEPKPKAGRASTKKSHSNGSFDFNDAFNEGAVQSQIQSPLCVGFTPLSLEGVDCIQKGDDLSYRFKIPYSQLGALVSILEKEKIYSVALIDFCQLSMRSSLINLVQKSGL